MYSNIASYYANPLCPSHLAGKSPPVISAFLSKNLCTFEKGTAGSQAHP